MRIYPVWQLARAGGYDDLLTALLQARGLDLEELQVGPEGLHAPELLCDLERGAERIERAVRRRETIVVYGDYDVDGVTSTVLLLDFLERAGARCHYLLPDRHLDGYGLKPAGVDKALALGADLVITVDNGISAFEALALARQRGVDVVVIDHHRQNDDLPPAYSIINPNRLDCDYPFKGLAGVGVAFKVVQHLSQSLLRADERRGYLNGLLDLVALGTVADVVPLLDENRVLVRYGLKAAERSARPGLQELRTVARCSRGPLDTTALAFFLGPRLNVAGRLETPDLALRLLRATDPEEGRRLAERLNTLNSHRQLLQKEGIAQAQALITDEVLQRERLLCVLGEEWDLGVIGLIASHLCQTHHRPAVVVSDVQRNGLYVGSARSIPAYDINDGINACADFLTTYGGHAAAAGFSLAAGQYEAFRASLVDHANAGLTAADLEACLEVDLEIRSQDIGMDTVRRLRDIEPFGQGHPVPVFVARDLQVEAVTRMGRDASHLKLAFGVGPGTVSGVWWRRGEVARELAVGQRVDVAFELTEDTYNGVGAAQIVIRDMCAAGTATTAGAAPAPHLEGVAPSVP